MKQGEAHAVRPRLLFLGPTLPYPPHRGRAFRTYHVLRLLASRYEVDALLFHDRIDPTQMPLRDRVAHIEELARVELFGIPGEWSVARRLWDRARSALGQQSEAHLRFEHRRYRRRVLELVFQRDPQLVHVDGLALHGYLPLLTGRRVVLSHHRLESAYLDRRARLARGPEASRLERQVRQVERIEQRWLPHVTANVVSSVSDRDALLAEEPTARVEVIPPAVDVRHYTPGSGTGQGLAAVGGSTPTSRDALEFFAGEILPRLKRVSGIQALEPITWVGSAGAADRTRFREVGIDLTGYVEDIRPMIRPAACYLVPRRLSGGATRILQAWAMGKAVVSTSIGCEGLDARDGRNILVRDDPDAFAAAVLDLLRDPQLRARLGDAGRRTVEEQYSWEIAGPRLLELYRELEDSRPFQAPPAR